MKTSPRLVAALAAATLLLTACGSDDAADTSSSAPVAASTTASAEPSRAESSAAESTSEEASQESTSDESTSDETTSDGSAESVEPTLIIGGDVDSLDETSAAWFSAMCEGIVPLVTAADILSETGSDPAAAAASVEQMGAGLVTASDNLAGLPAPTFDGGEDLATVVIDGLKSTGEKFQEASAQIAANDPAALTTINEALETNPLGELQGSKMNPELQDDFRALPACAPLNN